jgi:hydrogenase large subunit
MTPTTWNVDPNDDKGNSGPIETSLKGTENEYSNDPEEVGMAACSFDSSMVCTVHAHDGQNIIYKIPIECTTGILQKG